MIGRSSEFMAAVPAIRSASATHLLSRSAVRSSSLASISSAAVSRRRMATLYLSSASGKSSESKCDLPSALSITTADSMASKPMLIDVKM